LSRYGHFKTCSFFDISEIHARKTDIQNHPGAKGLMPWLNVIVSNQLATAAIHLDFVMFVQEPLDVGYVRRRVLFILETIS
jgi:hypothetical protein